MAVWKSWDDEPFKTHLNACEGTQEAAERALRFEEDQG